MADFVEKDVGFLEVLRHLEEVIQQQGGFERLSKRGRERLSLLRTCRQIWSPGDFTKVDDKTLTVYRQSVCDAILDCLNVLMRKGPLFLGVDGAEKMTDGQWQMLFYILENLPRASTKSVICLCSKFAPLNSRLEEYLSRVRKMSSSHVKLIGLGAEVRAKPFLMTAQREKWTHDVGWCLRGRQFARYCNRC